MAEIKITTNQIRDLALKMSDSAQLAENLSYNINRAFVLISNNAFNSSIGNISQKMCSVERSIWDLQGRISAGKEYLNTVADKFEETDHEIILSIDDEKLATLSDEEFMAFVSDQYDKEIEYGEIVDKYNRKEKIDVSGYLRKRNGMRSDGMGYFFTYENGCTWYAFSRWSEVNGSDLVFLSHPGNASNWANSIDKNVMNCISTSEENSIISNSVAVDVDGNHVVYIEAVIDGMVYFSQSSYNDPSIAGQIKAVSVEQFRNTYEYIISAK